MGDVSRREHVVREILGGLALAVVLGIVSVIPGGWAWLWGLVVKLGDPVTIPRWWYWLLSVYLVSTLSLAFLTFWSRPLEHDAYREDSFFGVIWRWNWGRNGEPTGVWCWCPRCDRKMLYDEIPATLYEPRKTIYACQACTQPNERVGTVNSLIQAVVLEIDLKVRNGSWRRVVEGRKQSRS